MNVMNEQTNIFSVTPAANLSECNNRKKMRIAIDEIGYKGQMHPVPVLAIDVVSPQYKHPKWSGG